MAEKPVTAIEMKWEDGLRFRSTDSFGHTVIVDAPTEEGQTFQGMMPGGLLLTSLAGCSGIDVVGILLKQRQEVTGIEIRVKGTQQSEAPWAYETIDLEYIIRGKALKDSAVRRAIHLSETKYCSVGATIGASTGISSTYRIEEEAS